MSKIRLAHDLAFPAEVVTQTLVVFGKRGTGKSSTAVVLAEQLHHAKIPFVAIDPKGDWWGMKAGADGKSPGLEVHVFGGRHGDLPLEPSAGALLADVIVDHRLSAILDVRNFTGGEKNRFVIDFAKRLIQKNQDPLHVILDEAHEVAPQNVQESDVRAECVGAVAKLVKEGRTSGIGVSAVTQRPAALSKNITTQAEILVLHKILGPQDVEAARQWIKYHGTEQDQVLREIATLKTGEAFVWAPDFPEPPTGLVRVRFNRPETFDSRATPKPGERRVEPKRLAPVELEKLRGRMAETIERAKADDPKELRAEIARLKKEAAAKPKAAPVDEKALLEKARNAATCEFATRSALLVRELRDAFDRTVDKILALAPQGPVGGILREAARHVLGGKDSVEMVRPLPTVLVAERGRRSVIHRERSLDGSSIAVTGVAEPITGPMERVLAGLAWLESTGLAGPYLREQVAFAADYSPTSSSFTNPCGTLRGRDLIAYPKDGYLALTEEGRSIAPRPVRAGNAEELQRQVLAKLSGPERRILEPLLRAYPKPLTREELAAASDYSITSSSFTNPLGSLRKQVGAIDYPSEGSVVALPWLFPEA